MGIGLGIGINRSNYAQGIFGAYQSRVIADGGVTEAGACVDAVSSLLQSASLLLIPSGYKSGKAYAQIPTNGNGDLTWTRASTALRTNSSGLLESMGSGVPRLSYMYGSCPALLLEPQRTNLALQSESFDSASWTKNNTTVSANNATSPDGTTNADLIYPSSSGSDRRFQQSISITNGVTYTSTIYAKASGLSWIRMFAAPFTQGTYFNVSSGTIGTIGSGVTASITSVGNGWYRCSVTQTATSTTTGQFYVNITDGDNNSVVTANGTNGILFYGAQCEVGAYSSTYIPTTTASATRVADSFSRNNIYTNGLITSSGGTWFVELRGNVAYTRDGTGNFWIGDSSVDGSGGSVNSLTFRNNGGGSPRLAINKVINGTLTALYTTTTDTAKIAIKWNGTSVDVFVNGTKQVSASAFTPTNMEFLRGAASDVPKFIQAMALYPSPLSDTDCTTLTTL
jgi:hypothetical protein